MPRRLGHSSAFQRRAGPTLAGWRGLHDTLDASHDTADATVGQRFRIGL